MAFPIVTAFAFAASSANSKEPEITAEDLRDAAVQYEIMNLEAQGYAVAATCKNPQKARAGFIVYSEEEKTYQLVLAEGNTMRGRLIKKADTTTEDLKHRLNNHCFPSP